MFQTCTTLWMPPVIRGAKFSNTGFCSVSNIRHPLRKPGARSPPGFLCYLWSTCTSSPFVPALSFVLAINFFLSVTQWPFLPHPKQDVVFFRLLSIRLRFWLASGWLIYEILLSIFATFALLNSDSMFTFTCRTIRRAFYKVISGAVLVDAFIAAVCMVWQDYFFFPMISHITWPSDSSASEMRLSVTSRIFLASFDGCELYYGRHTTTQHGHHGLPETVSAHHDRDELSMFGSTVVPVASWNLTVLRLSVRVFHFRVTW